MSQLNKLFGVFERFGFDRPKFLIGLQVAFVAFAALVVAWLLRLEHPQWAAITVMLTLQPTRGQLVEKAVYRFLGTIVGSLFGAAVGWFAQGQLEIELTAIIIWSSLMVFIGALQRSYRSYATLLAGYSAIIVIVLNPFEAEMVPSVAFDRIVTVFIGAIAAVIWAYGIRMMDPQQEMRVKARRLAADVLRQAGMALRDPHQRDMAAFTRLARACGQLQDELLQLTANGGVTSNARKMEQLLQALNNLMFAAYQQPFNPELGKALEHLAEKLHGQSDFDGIASGLKRALALTHDAVLDGTLTTLMVRADHMQHKQSALQIVTTERRRYALDWAGATQGGIRVFIVLSIFGLGWVLSGSALFQFPLVSASICMALSTTGVTPSRKMEEVVKGQLSAAVIAVAIEMILWRLFPSPVGQLLCMSVAAIAFAFIRSHRKFSIGAPDFAIVVFLLLSASYVDYQETYFPPLRAFMAVLGGILGYFAFRLIFPTDARARRKALWVMIKRDLQEVALMRNVSLTLEGWRQSFAPRFLKITHWAALENGRYERMDVTMRKGFLTMQLAEVVFMAKGMQQRAGLSDSLRRALEAALMRIANTDKETERLVRTLSLLSMRLMQAGFDVESQTTERCLAEITDLRRLRKEK